jgi:hypothetical protein
MFQIIFLLTFISCSVIPMLKDYKNILETFSNKGFKATVCINDGFIEWFADLCEKDKKFVKYLVKIRDLDVITCMDKPWVTRESIWELFEFNNNFMFSEFNGLSETILITNDEHFSALALVKNILKTIFTNVKKDVNIITIGEQPFIHTIDDKKFSLISPLKFDNNSTEFQSHQVYSTLTDFVVFSKNSIDFIPEDSSTNGIVLQYNQETQLLLQQIERLVNDIGTTYLIKKQATNFNNNQEFLGKYKKYKINENKFFSCIAKYADICKQFFSDYIIDLQNLLKVINEVSELQVSCTSFTPKTFLFNFDSERTTKLNHLKFNSLENSVRLLNPLTMVDINFDLICFEKDGCELFFETDSYNESGVFIKPSTKKKPKFNSKTYNSSLILSEKFSFEFETIKIAANLNETISFQSEVFSNISNLYNFNGKIANITVLELLNEHRVTLIEYNDFIIFEFKQGKISNNEIKLTIAKNNVTYETILFKQSAGNNIHNINYKKLIGENNNNEISYNDCFYFSQNNQQTVINKNELIYNDPRCSTVEYRIVNLNQIFIKVNVKQGNQFCTTIFKSLYYLDYSTTILDFNFKAYEYESLFLHNNNNDKQEIKKDAILNLSNPVNYYLLNFI